MPLLPLRPLPTRPAGSLADQWLEQLEHELSQSSADRATICRRALCELAYPQFASSWESAVEDASIPTATRLALAALDPRNITLEPEYYGECDDPKFQAVKPLLW